MTLEQTLQGWTGPSSLTEEEKQNRTVNMVKQAISSSDELDGTSLTIYAKGSYANQTNVRLDSDVDIGVQCHEVEYWEEQAPGAHPSGPSYAGPWTPQAFRSAVERALRDKFTNEVNSQGSIAIKVKSSSARVDADVVPSFDYRYYFTNGAQRTGTRIFSKNMNAIANYPQEQLVEGQRKNMHTLNRFTQTVRLLKRLENSMREDGYHREVPSFLVECLVYNCTDNLFLGSWVSVISNVLVTTWQATQGDAEPGQGRWLEVSRCKYLFGEHQPWSRKDAREFSYAAWNYLELG